jgi:DNA-binding NarL/FixJ family response regulator
MIRILLIDDHLLFRDALARLLAGQPDFQIAGECATVEEGIEVLKRGGVDVVLLDINLGLQQGGAFLKPARDHGFGGRILVVTAGVSKLEASRLLQRGCSRIILKHESPELLIQSIREGIDADEPSPGTKKEDLERLESAGQPVLNPLTAREREVLRAVFEGLGNKEIAFNLGVSEPLVKSIIQQLFTKTGARTRTQLVRIAIEQYWRELE